MDKENGNGAVFERIEADVEFLKALTAHVEAPSDETWGWLQGLSKVVVDRGGHDLARGIDVGIGPLLDRDPVAWASLLGSVFGPTSVQMGPVAWNRLKDASPFAGKLIVFSHRHGSGIGYHGETDAIVARAVEGYEPIPTGGEISLIALDPAQLSLARDMADVGC